MKRTLRILGAAVAALTLLLTPAAVTAETAASAAIAGFELDNYDVRTDYTGEIGFYFKSLGELTVTEVAVPFFEGNVKSTVTIYALKASPALPGQIAHDELEPIGSAGVVLADATEDALGFVHAALATPITLQKDKEYLITMTSGKIGDTDYVKFFNSGVGASPKAVVSGAEVDILSCSFSYNLDTTKSPLYADGAQFAIDTNVPKVAFGFPNFYYTVVPEETPTPTPVPATPTPTPVPPTPTPASPFVNADGGLSTLSIVLIAIAVVLVAGGAFLAARGKKK